MRTGAPAPRCAGLSTHTGLEPQLGLLCSLKRREVIGRLVSAGSFTVSQVMMGTAAMGCFCLQTDPWTPLESFEGDVLGGMVSAFEHEPYRILPCLE